MSAIEALAEAVRDEKAVIYRYIDTAGTRLHCWQSGDSVKYAKGFGPIQYISETEFIQAIHGDMNVSAGLPRNFGKATQ